MSTRLLDTTWHYDWACRASRASLGVWRGLALLGGVLGVCPVRGWLGPRGCTALSAPAAHAFFLTSVLTEFLIELWHLHNHRRRFTPMVVLGLVVLTFRTIALWGVLCRRRTLAAVSECLRLYRECHDAQSARDAAAQLVLALWVLLEVVIFSWEMHMIGKCVRKRSIVFEAGRILNVVLHVKWAIAFALMVYPMLVEGSLAADVRRSCVRLSRERLGLLTPKAIEDATHAWRGLRLRQHELYDMSTTSCGIYQERILLLVVCTLFIATMCLATSVLEFGHNVGISATTAVVGLNYFLSLAMLGFICQLFSFESACIREALQGVLVQAGRRQDRDIAEVSMFINQIDQQSRSSVWGVFQVDTSFTWGVLLGTTTYVAFLCQMSFTFRGV